MGDDESEETDAGDGSSGSGGRTIKYVIVGVTSGTFADLLKEFLVGFLINLFYDIAEPVSDSTPASSPTAVATGTPVPGGTPTFTGSPTPPRTVTATPYPAFTYRPFGPFPGVSVSVAEIVSVSVLITLFAMTLYLLRELEKEERFPTGWSPEERPGQHREPERPPTLTIGLLMGTFSGALLASIFFGPLLAIAGGVLGAVLGDTILTPARLKGR